MRSLRAISCFQSKLFLTSNSVTVRTFGTKSCLNMRFVQFLKGDNPTVQRLGIEKDGTNQIIDVSGTDRIIPGSLVKYLENKDVLSVSFNRAVKQEAQVYEQSEIVLLPPVTKPDKVICVGLNYKRHCDEQNVPYPDEPFFFSKFPSCIIGPEDGVIHPSNTKALDWEVELAVIIGKKCRHVTKENAYNYIFGYTVAQDISARDWQTPKKNKGQWLMAKSMDTFCPLGPVIVTTDDIKNPHDLTLRCSVNDVEKQNSKTDDLVHGIDKIISYLSGCFTLLPGDVILTGTPGGVGVFRRPKEFLVPGDIIRSEISGIGVLFNTVEECPT